MRLLDRVAFGCVVRLPRWKLALPPGLKLAERVGFEPTCPEGSADFKSAPFYHFGTSPKGQSPAEQ
jgi:hypothetical protein